VTIDYDYKRDYKTNNFNILFIGNMRTNANQDMVFNFVDNIFPLVIERIPNAKFFIVGAQPPKSVKNLEKKVKGVYVTGKVTSTNLFFEKAAVSVCPVRVGAGMQNKILESMAHGIPVVTTIQGAESIIDLDETNQTIIKVSETNIDFANSVCSFLTSDKLREQYGICAREYVENKFKWESQLYNYIE
jgi:glycosyltransferase involved in cell wall biosynthesis